jgi:hypothetical protein
MMCRIGSDIALAKGFDCSRATDSYWCNYGSLLLDKKKNKYVKRCQWKIGNKPYQGFFKKQQERNSVCGSAAVNGSWPTLSFSESMMLNGLKSLGMIKLDPVD